MGATHKINADVEVTGTLSVSSTTAVGGTVFGTSAKFGRDADNLIDFATTDNQIRFRVNGGDEANMTNAFFYPHSNDGMALGQAATSWSDLFLASGGVIGFNNGDVTLTHSSNTLTISGGAVVLDASDHVIKDGGNILDENDNTLISTSGGACNISGSAATLTNARTIGGVSFNGSANINLPGVNTSGNQDTSGNAATATALTSGNKTIAGILDITDATDSSDATGDTGALRTEGGASIAKQLYVGTDLSVGGKVTTTEIEGSSILLDSAADIELNCDGADVILKDATTEFGRFKNDSSDFVIKSAVSNKDMIFKGVDGGSAITALTLDMSEAGKATFNNDVVAFSDRKLKDNIETLDGKKVLDMRGVSFTRKDTGLASSGVIAQEIQEVAPELVNETNGTLGVSYGNLVGYLIEAIKDQQKQIDELKEMCNGCSR
jgi:hypothetical protein